MKPFDLKAALAGDPVVTRDGRRVKLAGHNPDAIGEARLLGWAEDGGSLSWYADGRYNQDPGRHDLFMAPKKRVVWVNLYDEGGMNSAWHDTEEKADKLARSGRIGGKAWPLEIEE